MKMKIDWTTDSGFAVEKHGQNAIVRVSPGRFMVARWNTHHKNWVRRNRHEGGAVHRSLDTIATDNLGGGPELMTLNAARESLDY